MLGEKCWQRKIVGRANVVNISKMLATFLKMILFIFFPLDASLK
jgi:hypothetical protein